MGWRAGTENDPCKPKRRIVFCKGLEQTLSLFLSKIFFFCLFVRDLAVRTWYMDLLGTFAGAVFFFFNSIDNLDKCLLAVRLSSNSENFLE